MTSKKDSALIKRKIFSFDSYKEALAYYLVEEAPWGYMTRASEHIGCQVSFLTRVIKDKPQLTPDHAFHLADFLRFNIEEKKYFLMLVDFERASDPEFKSHLKNELKELKKKNESISERTQRKYLTFEVFRANYFSSWIYTAIHFIVSCPNFQKIDAIATRFNVKKSVVKKCLQELEEQGLVESHKGEQWFFKSGNFHLEKNSPLVVLHHQNWRTRAIADAQDFSNDSIHFTSVCTLSEADAQKLKEMMLEFISNTNRVVGPSDNEECIAICCDLFKV
ncbi:MAG: TIGR02147 family protein [Bacteriovoracaceae bacterium]